VVRIVLACLFLVVVVVLASIWELEIAFCSSMFSGRETGDIDERARIDSKWRLGGMCNSVRKLELKRLRRLCMLVFVCHLSATTLLRGFCNRDVVTFWCDFR
jgi:hypothetical protein